ncbi:MAG: tRNA (adenosine(37)-N6)-threonylcarbamoyltransferase complex ATPase subunit type 1 TsaE [Candidatus Berkelbacteria bacterium]|nr:tRNA (adenosine(37)-N6)-threonylcarbamoyltransferase complex ATPase subunit type 1 TsaE [Candidatus Berkelbacteria bacterium]
MEYTTKSQAETEKLAKKLLRENPDIKLFGLVGDLGSGKTAFVKEAAKFFGIKKNITSPTFVIMKIYPAGDKKFVHIDAYRLSSEKDIEAIGFAELVDNRQNIIFIEWPERVFTKFPDEMKIINFEYKSENERKINF